MPKDPRFETEGASTPVLSCSHFITAVFGYLVVLYVVAWIVCDVHFIFEPADSWGRVADHL